MCIRVKRIKETKQDIRMEKGKEQRRAKGNDGDKNVPNTVINKVARKGEK
jgi:hypothetical protein